MKEEIWQCLSRTSFLNWGPMMSVTSPKSNVWKYLPIRKPCFHLKRMWITTRNPALEVAQIYGELCFGRVSLSPKRCFPGKRSSVNKRGKFDWITCSFARERETEDHSKRQHSRRNDTCNKEIQSKNITKCPLWQESDGRSSQRG